eukprot:m.53476 g.53476  ORF g.53476 m.53476 type:complete len:505 (-) comp48585_c0_seq4:114-1628(-)
MRTFTPTCLAYGAATLFQSMQHYVFLLYHIQAYTTVFGIDQQGFYIGEIIFLVWNSVNDFVFGWAADQALLGSTGTRTRVSSTTILGRIRNFRIGGPGLALSFLLFWFPMVSPGIQFTVCLFLYDGFLTYVDLAHSALLADLATTEANRARLSIYSSFGAAIGSVSVFIASVLWDEGDLSAFRTYCLLLAAVSAIGFEFSSRILRRTYLSETQRSSRSRQDELSSVAATASLSSTETAEHFSASSARKAASWFKFLKELCASQNFLWFSLLQLIQVFHCHFNSNFFPFFVQIFLAQYLSPNVQAMLLATTFLLPHINNIFFNMLVQKRGVYFVIALLIGLKFSLAVGMLALGPYSSLMLILFIASNRVVTEGMCKLLNLVISDLVDEDYVRNNRDQAVSALIFGTCSLLSKPGQTLAPLIGTWLIAQNVEGYLFSGEAFLGPPQENLSPSSLESLREVLFQLLVYVPITCSLVQAFCWKKFTLRGRYLQQIQQKIAKGLLEQRL